MEILADAMPDKAAIPRSTDGMVDIQSLLRLLAEQVVNAIMDEEADQLVGAGPYERTDERAAYRAEHYERGFTTTSGQVTLKMPKLKDMRFATAVIERRKTRRTRVVGTFPDGKSALMLAAVRLKYVADSEWGSRRYLDMSLLKEQSC